MRSFNKLAKPTAILIVFTLLLSMSMPLVAPGAAVEAARLQPYLAEMAAASPNQTIRVIVQKADGSERAERFAEKLGAHIYADLGIINGFAAEIIGSKIKELAAHETVQWVSYDAPMTYSADLPKKIYYSVGTSTADLKSGTPKMTISSGTATFSVSQPDNIGVGDTITYSSSKKAYISGRNSPTSFSVITATGGTPPNVTGATVNSIKRTFNNLSQAKYDSSGSAYLNTWDLRAGNFQLNWPCYNDGPMDDRPYIDGYITDADRHIRIYTPHLSSEVGTSQRHTGVTGTGFKLVPPDNYDGITLRNAYVYVEGLEIVSSNGAGVWITGNPEGKLYVAGNLIHDVDAEYGTYGIAVTGIDFPTTVYIWNNFIYHTDAAIHLAGSDITAYVYSNSIYNVNVGVSDEWAISTVKSNVVLGCADYCFGGPGGNIDVQSHNISSDGTASGTGSLTMKSAANNFVNTAAGSENLHLKDGADCIGKGADLDQDPYLAITHDIDGDSRDASAPDVGADEYQGSSPDPAPTPTPTEDPTPTATPTEDPSPTPTPATTSSSYDPPTVNYYREALGVDQLGTVAGRPLEGKGVTVVVLDSGVNYDVDFLPPNATVDRIPAHISAVPDQVAFFLSVNNDVCAKPQTGKCWYVTDQYGHGTHVAGIIGGDGGDSNGLYTGIAPQVDIINMRVADKNGMAYESSIVAGMQLILTHKNSTRYPIRVVNISMNSTVEQSYNTSPVNAAGEILWLNGIVVVVSAGNSGTKSYNTINAGPANDPYFITVGAVDQMATAARADDTIPTFSAYGVTMDGYAKPEVYAPGRHIISVLSAHSPWNTQHPDRVLGNGQYFRASGTSMSAPMVAGAAAVLLDLKPSLTPDQIKYVLMHTGSPISYNGQSGPYLDILAAARYVHNTSNIPSANQGNIPHMLLRQVVIIPVVIGPVADANCVPDSPCDLSGIDWNEIDWASINWPGVDWEGINWAGIIWDSINWTGIDWEGIPWAEINWAGINWAGINWAGINWTGINWTGINWTGINWTGINWTGINWTGINWTGINWVGMEWTGMDWSGQLIWNSIKLDD